MRDQLTKLVAAGKIQRCDIEPLLKLLESGYGFHKSWGTARIRQLDPLFGRLVVDFADRPNHVMDLKLAAKVLEPLPPQHILVRRLEAIDQLRRLAKEDPRELLRQTLISYPEGLTISQLRNILTPDVIQPENWDQWWSTVKEQLKKDPQIVIPKRPTQPLRYLSEPVGVEERFRDEFIRAGSLKKKLQVVQDALSSWSEMSDPGAWAAEIIGLLNEEIKKHLSTEPALALQALFLRDDIRQRVPDLRPEPDEPTFKTVIEAANHVVQLLHDLPASRYVSAIQALIEAKPAEGKEILFGAFERGDVRLCGECVEALERMGWTEELKQWIQQRIYSRTIPSELLAFVIEKRPQWLQGIEAEPLFLAIIYSLEQHYEQSQKPSALAAYILRNPRYLVDLLQALDPDTIMDLARALYYSTAFDQLDRRSLLAQLAKEYPYVDELLVTVVRSGEGKLLVSPESFERKRMQLEKIINEELPETSREIERARSYGDLRENYEYKAARERYFFLLKRKADLERELASAELINLSDIPTDMVGLGSTVTLRDLNTGSIRQVTILGAWDTSEDGSVVSYLSPLGQALLGRRPGEEVELETDVELEKVRFRIEKIEPYRKASSQGSAGQDT